MNTQSRWILAIATLILAAGDVGAEPRALAAGSKPDDHRLDAPKDLDGYFPFSPPKSLDAWEARAQELRERLSVVLGLHPAPPRAALNPVIHGKKELDGYSLSKVYFESIPGFYVTGSLYRPIGYEGKRPGILCPHGHWSSGRFYINDGVKNEIAIGAERFVEEGKSPLQSRCVQLARMGCIVFHYDMIGYADSQQIPESVAHRFSERRPHMNDPESWGFFSPQAESHFQNIMGLQTWNSIRALDFLETLEDVDSERLAVTGASGGGTQSFILDALDDRLAAAFPAVMVSTAMQGGCTCENTCGLRIETGNVEIAALFAPKPLGLTNANDWTVEMESKGFPELKQLYSLYNKPDHTHLTVGTHFGHNYNYVSRTAMYHWFNEHLDLGFDEPILETHFDLQTPEELTVWGVDHPQPDGGEDYERRLLQEISKATRETLRNIAEKQGVAKLRETLRVGLSHVIGRTSDQVGAVDWELKDKYRADETLVMNGLLKSRARRETLPVVFLYPDDYNQTVTIWPTANGKSALFTDDGAIDPKVQRVLDSGRCVVGVDLVYQGEFLDEGAVLTETPKVENPRQFAGYTLGYNHSVFAQRTHDLLTVIEFLHSNDEAPESVELLGTQDAAHWVAATIGIAGHRVDAAAIALNGFRFGDVNSIRSPDFLPGGAKYFDAPGMIAASITPHIWVGGESDNVIQALARVRESEVDSSASNSQDSAISWLIDR